MIIFISDVFGILAGVFAISAYIPYIRAIIYHQTIPSRSTWIIWTVASLILLSSYFSVGAKGTIWVPLAYSVGTVIVMLLSLKYGVKGWSQLDIMCFLGSFVSIILWIIFGSPLLALLMNLILDTIGSFPTMKKARSKPESEDKLGWSLFFLGVCLNFVSSLLGQSVTFEILIYPIVMFLTVGTIFYFVSIKSYFENKIKKERKIIK